MARSMTVSKKERQAGIISKEYYSIKLKAWLCLVDPRKLRIDHGYQRDLVETRSGGKNNLTGE